MLYNALISKRVKPFRIIVFFTWLSPEVCCACWPVASAIDAASAAASASSSDIPAWMAATACLDAAAGRLEAPVGWPLALAAAAAAAWLLGLVCWLSVGRKGPEKKLVILDWVDWPPEEAAARVAAAAAARLAAAEAACRDAAAGPAQLWSSGCLWVRQKVSLQVSQTI